MTREKQWKATHNHIFEWVSELRDNIVQVKVKMQIIFFSFFHSGFLGYLEEIE
jgi:hypothetical protein